MHCTVVDCEEKVWICMKQNPPLRMLEAVLGIATLIVEGRVPSSNCKHGYLEGPHYLSYPPTLANRREIEVHHCDLRNDPFCIRMNTYTEKIKLLWEECGALCIEILVCPDCECGSNQTLCNSSTSDYVLERWFIMATKDGSKNSLEQNSRVSWHSLLQAVRSQLHFSQLCAWWSSNGGQAPKNLCYQVVSKQQDAYADTSATWIEHTFPLLSLETDKTKYLQVQLKCPPRTDKLPNVHCSLHPTSDMIDDRELVCCNRQGKHRCEDVDKDYDESNECTISSHEAESDEELTADVVRSKCKKCRRVESKDEQNSIGKQIVTGKICDRVHTSVVQSEQENNVKNIPLMQEKVHHVDINERVVKQHCYLKRSAAIKDSDTVINHNDVEHLLEFGRNTFNGSVGDDNLSTITCTPVSDREFVKNSITSSVPSVDLDQIAPIVPSTSHSEISNDKIGAVNSKSGKKRDEYPGKVKKPNKRRSNPLLGNFTESVLNERFNVRNELYNYKCKVIFAPDAVIGGDNVIDYLPMIATFYSFGNGEIEHSYLVKSQMCTTGYSRIPMIGSLQLILMNDRKEVMQTFFMKYDWSKMKAYNFAMIRQRIYKKQNTKSDDHTDDKYLIYVLNCKFKKHKPNHLFLHEVKLLVFNKCNEDDYVYGTYTMTETII